MKYKLSLAAIAVLSLSACNNSNETQSPQETTFNSLVNITEINAGENCASGGIRVDSGVDSNANNTLDADELIEPRFYCNDGSRTVNGDAEIYGQSLVSVLSVTKDDNDCSAGGQKVIAAIDSNDDGVIQTEEIVDTFTMCNQGDYVSDELMINAITSSSSVAPPNSTVLLRATISNLTASDRLYWIGANGDVLAPTNSNVPNEITVTVGANTGIEEYKLYLYREGGQDDGLIQSKTISITVGENAQATQSVFLDNSQVLLPKGYTVQPVTGDFIGTAIYGDSVVSPSARINRIPTQDDIDLVGFVSERPSLGSGSNSIDILSYLMGGLSSSLSGNVSVTQFSQNVLPNGDISASYNINYALPSVKTTTLLNEIMQQIGVNKVGGIADALVASNNEIDNQNFQFNIVLSYADVLDSIVLTTTLVEKSLYEQYETLIVSTTSENVLAPVDAKLKLQNDSYKAIEQVTSKADFLFVIDNSGSMSGEQNMISQLTQSFSNYVGSTGMDFKVGTITTDRDTLRGVGFTDDLAQIELDLKPGTNGSANERGIYFAEQALTPVTGTVALDGYPRANSTMSVIIMSDEESHYSGSPAFDPLDNLFVDNNFRVYSIVEPRDIDRSQYDDLSNATLGLVLNIQEMSEYDGFMEKIAQNAGASSAGYSLSIVDSEAIISSSIAVKVNGVDVTRDATNGWQYYPQTNSIVFTGTAIPAVNADIVFAYQYFKA
ncbi:VWA domain-containing protein [Moritella sp. 24]|uniref:VWA domain-containing protein n=1 Tax=Moritella sp. 24 TaxID=2746230 RepID=UPI001BA85B91|nr:VWA domain-containing protein [Moritella sp. 24]